MMYLFLIWCYGFLSLYTGYRIGTKVGTQNKLRSLDTDMQEKAYLTEDCDPNYLAGYNQAIDDCRMNIRARANRIYRE